MGKGGEDGAQAPRFEMILAIRSYFVPGGAGTYRREIFKQTLTGLWPTKLFEHEKEVHY